MQHVEQRRVSGHTIDPSILREYDIRGVVGQTLSVDDCYFIGRSFGTIVSRLGGKSIVVGYDGRETSPIFADAIRKGLAESGLSVEDIGLGPTPMAYFAMKHRKRDAAVIITGSHSPIHYNGIKMTLHDRPFYGEDVQEVGRVSASGDFVNGDGDINIIDIKEEYVDRLVADYTGSRDLKVVWDAGNGAGGEILRMMTAKLPGEHILIFDEIDGSFPNHHPDPTVAKNLVDLQKMVKEHGCDVGIGLDGDADRIGAVDQNTKIVWADQMMAVYAGEVLKTHPGTTIIGDIKCSVVFFDEVARLGGKPLMWNTGHSLIKAKMKETNSPLAGELAGHICFADKYYGFDDGLYCGIRLLNLISDHPKGMAGLTQHLPEIFNTPEVRFPVSAARKFEIAPEIKQRLIAQNSQDIEITDIDGVRVSTKEGWWLMRPSNTEDVLTVRVEAFSQEGLEKLTASLVDQLRQSGIESPF